MTGREAIEDLDGLMGAINERVNELHDAGHAAAKQWDGLQRCGGQRDDHAAALLKDVRRALARLQEMATRAGECVDAVIANPFGDR